MLDHLKSKGLTAIAHRRRWPPLRGAARVSRAYLNAYENLNYDLRSNGEEQVVRRLAPRFTTAIDVGVHRGRWTDLVLGTHPRATVHGFEAAPATTSALLDRYATEPRVVINPSGLGSAAGSATMYLGRRSSTNSLVPDPAADSIEVEVAIEKGDTYLADHGIDHVDYLKIDVEGYDFEVLRGFRDALQGRAVDALQFEYNWWNIRARRLLADFYDLLDPLGYDIGKVRPDGVVFRPYSWEDENWIGPACVAVLRSRHDLIESVRTP